MYRKHFIGNFSLYFDVTKLSMGKQFDNTFISIEINKTRPVCLTYMQFKYILFILWTWYDYNGRDEDKQQWLLNIDLTINSSHQSSQLHNKNANVIIAVVNTQLSPTTSSLNMEMTLGISVDWVWC